MVFYAIGKLSASAYQDQESFFRTILQVNTVYSFKNIIILYLLKMLFMKPESRFLFVLGVSYDFSSPMNNKTEEKKKIK